VAAQHRLLGAPCPILACAIEHGVEYCPRDCDRFPCDAFKAGPYPFSQAFLNMQERRRRERPPGRTPLGDMVQVPAEYWEALRQKDPASLCENTLARTCSPDGLIVRFLGEDLLVDTAHCSLHRFEGTHWERVQESLLELLCLVYLLNTGPEPLTEEMVGPQELRDAHFFHGPHELRVQPLLQRYGDDVDGFKRAAERIGGEALELADAAYRLWAFPKVPLYYLFWKGDEEFEPRLSILFDRSIQQHLSADAIWGLVNLVSDILLVGSKRLPA
jgi:hypothetical protein